MILAWGLIAACRPNHKAAKACNAIKALSWAVKGPVAPDAHACKEGGRALGSVMGNVMVSVKLGQQVCNRV